MSSKTLTPEQKAAKAEANRRYREKKKAEKAGQPTPPSPAADANNLRAVMLTYDIPSDSEIDNPSGELRRIGFRSNLSCWVIPEGSLPLTLIHTLRTEGRADVDIVKFDASEGPRLVQLAIRNMRKELEGQIQRTKENLAKWEASYLNDGEDNTEERKAAHDRYVSRSWSILRRLKTLADDLDAAIRNFGVDPAEIGVSAARSSFDLMQEGVAKRAEAYVVATNALKAAGTGTTSALAAGAAKDQVPGYVMADALREAGDEAAADALQEAFSDRLEPTPAPADENEFSLVGGDEAAA
jgi:hypothetical protein